MHCAPVNDHTNNLKLANRFKQADNDLNRLMLENGVNISAVHTCHVQYFKFFPFV